MSGQRVTIDDLRRILVEVAGAPEPADGTQRPDAELEDLGYDSIAVLAAISKIESDYGVRIDEERLPEATRLSDVVELINAA